LEALELVFKAKGRWLCPLPQIQIEFLLVSVSNTFGHEKRALRKTRYFNCKMVAAKNKAKIPITINHFETWPPEKTI